MDDLIRSVGLLKALAKKPDPEKVTEAVEGWLDDHPEATTTVEDGVITRAKLSSSLAGEIDGIESALGDSNVFVAPALEIGGNGYIDANDLSVKSPTSSWRYTEPVAVKKGMKYVLTAQTNAIVSSITKAEQDGTLVALAKAGTSDASLTWECDYDGYAVFCFNINSAYSLTGTMDVSQFVPLKDELDEIEASITTDKAVLYNGVEELNLDTFTFESKGYITSYGEFVAPTSNSHKIVKADASHLRQIKFKTATAFIGLMAFGVLKDSNGNTLEIFNTDGTTGWQTWDITPKDGNVIYIAYYDFATVPNPYYSTIKAKLYNDIVSSYKDEILGLSLTPDPGHVKYMTCVKKPFDFNGKTIYFFGDSITYGYIAASGGTPAHQATDPFPKLFANAVGATHTNYGESGSTLSDVTGYASICTKIQDTTLSGADFVVIAGGINDWQLGVDEATLEDAVDDICSYLTANYSGEVIFITPINEAGRTPVNAPAQTVQNIRNVITRTALKYGYSVVQGWEFPFPVISDDPDYISLMFQDKIHPTELGYSMYAQALRSALC